MQVKCRSIHVKDLLESEGPLTAEIEFAEPDKIVEALGGTATGPSDETLVKLTAAEALAEEALERAETAETALKDANEAVETLKDEKTNLADQLKEAEEKANEAVETLNTVNDAFNAYKAAHPETSDPE